MKSIFHPVILLSAAILYNLSALRSGLPHCQRQRGETHADAHDEELKPGCILAAETFMTRRSLVKQIRQDICTMAGGLSEGSRLESESLTQTFGRLCGTALGV